MPSTSGSNSGLTGWQADETWVDFKILKGYSTQIFTSYI